MHMFDDDFEWQKQAACRGMSPSVFFPPQGDRRALKLARSVCEGCQVADFCLMTGWDQNEGIFGGKTATERRRLKRQETVRAG